MQLGEQGHYPDHPQLTRAELEAGFAEIQPRFEGENAIFVTRHEGRVTSFCWCVLFDPGTGLEGEIAEIYVSGEERGRGVGQALVQRALELFRERGVTLGYVWTRPENEAALRLYRGAGFRETSQLILTWYPIGEQAAGT